jgi:hypothetical protein
MQKIKAFGANILLLITSLCVGLLFLETATRIVVPKLNVGGEGGLGIADERGFTLLQKNLDGSIYSEEQKRDVHIKTNTEGFMGRDYPIERAPNTIRFALLGDSMLEAQQVDWEQTFAYRMEQEAKERWPEREFEFMNFGIGGQGTMEELMRYHYYVAKYQPDYVVLFFFPNDFENNQFYLEHRELILSRGKGWMNIPQANANFRIGRTDFKFRILKTFRIAQYIDQKVRSTLVLEKWAVKLGLHNAGVMGLSQNGIHQQFFVYQTPLQDGFSEIYDYSYELIRFLRDLVSADSSTLLVVYLPQAEQVDVTLMERARREIPALEWYQWDLERPNTFFAKKLAGIDVPYLDMTPVFKVYYSNNPGAHLYNVIDAYPRGHFNETGHELVSDNVLNFYARTQK